MVTGSCVSLPSQISLLPDHVLLDDIQGRKMVVTISSDIVSASDIDLMKSNSESDVDSESENELDINFVDDDMHAR